MKTYPILVAALLVALAACGGNDAPPPPATEAPATVSPSTASPTPAAAARVGATQNIVFPSSSSRTKATVYGYRQPLPSQFPPDRKGYVFAGLDVKVCLDVEGAVSWAPWSIVFADDTVIEPVSSWSEDWFSVPIYPPIAKTVHAGRCVRGWVLFEVPAGPKPVIAAYAPNDGDTVLTVEWKLR